MIIDKLENLPKEDQISDVLIGALSSNPKLVYAFVSQFAREHKEDAFRVLSRTQLASVLPGIPPELGRKKPDLILIGDRNLILVENKTGASLKEEQLGDYSAALAFDKKRQSSLLLIAPKTTRYGVHGHDIEMITWDQIYALIEQNGELLVDAKREITLNVLSRLRWEYFQKIYDDVVLRLSRLVRYDVSYAGQNAKDIYYSKHIILSAYPHITYSIGIFIKAPSYLLVDPFKIDVRGRRYDMNQGDPIVKAFKEKMRQLPGTNHALLPSMPGYVIDLMVGEDNSSESIAAEIKSILIDKSPDIQRILSQI
jgi:hypothetical protein